MKAPPLGLLLLCLPLLAFAQAPIVEAPVEPPDCRYGMFWKDSFAPPPAFAEQTRAPLPQRLSRYRVQVVAEGFEHPWSLAFLPDGRMLVSERAGRLRIVDSEGHLSMPLAGLPPTKRGPPGGLWDVVLDPGFAKNRLVYFNFFAPPIGQPQRTVDEDAALWAEWLGRPPAERSALDVGTGHVARATLSADFTRLEHVTVLASGVLDGRLRFARDGTLMITSGAPAGAGAAADGEPQDLANAYGKILRIRADSTIPHDNPFVGRSDARADLYAYGARDTQGAAIHPDSGALWTSESGPRGGDEINVVEPGVNLGHPIISYGREYSSLPLNGGLTAQPGMTQPTYFWTPSIAPSGMTFYSGTLFPEWRGNLFVAALAAKRLQRLVVRNGRVVAEEPLLLERCQRIRSVNEGPDGALYVLTDEEVGQLLKIVPAGRTSR